MASSSVSHDARGPAFPSLPSVSETFRLATLMPGKDASDPVECTTKPVSMKEDETFMNPTTGDVCVYHGKFDALSYVCGDPGVQKPIVLNGQKILVYENLEQALRTIRDPVEAQTLWIDCICINQDDDLERAAQIKLMSHIYTKAQKVPVWPGAEHAHMHQALKNLIPMGRENVLDSLRSLIDIVEEAEAMVSSSPAARKEAEVLVEEFLDSSTEESALGTIDDLLNRLAIELTEGLKSILGTRLFNTIRTILHERFLSRIWIVQEQLLAEKIEIVVGSQRYDGDKVLHGLRVFLRLHGVHDIGPFELDGRHFPAAPYPENILRLSKLRWEQSFQPPERRLAQLPRTLLGPVVHFLLAECTDPRDHVFALLGLSQRDNMTELNPPDYSLSYEQVMKRLTRTYIHHKQNLDILLWCGRSDRPSWTISTNFNTPRLTPTLLWEDRMYSTAKDTPIKYYIPDVPRADEILALAGFRIDVITAITSSHTETDRVKAPTSSEDPMLLEWWDLAREAEVEEVGFWMSLTGQWEPGKDDTLTKNEMAAMEIEVRTWLENDKSTTAWPSEIFYKAIKHAYLCDQFFVTKERRAGLSGRLLEVGDTICVLFGGQCPFAMYEKDDGWMLRNHCFLYGVMNGEAMDDFEEGVYEEEIFDLI